MKVAWVFILMFSYIQCYLLPYDFSKPYSEYKICGKCHHLYIDDKKMMKCRLFGKINVITGQVIYQDCLPTRQNNSQCGQDGNLFVKYIPFNSA